MMEHELFSMALGLSAPWEVVKLGFDAAANRITIGINFSKGIQRFGYPEFRIPECGVDTKPMRGRHFTNMIDCNAP